MTEQELKAQIAVGTFDFAVIKTFDEFKQLVDKIDDLQTLKMVIKLFVEKEYNYDGMQTRRKEKHYRNYYLPRKLVLDKRHVQLWAARGDLTSFAMRGEDA